MSNAIEQLLQNQTTTKRDYKHDWAETTRFDFKLDKPLPTPTMTVHSSGTVDASAIYIPGLGGNGVTDQIYASTGISGDNFIIVRNETQGIELALRFYKRGGSQVAAVGSESNGIFPVVVPAEPLIQVGSDYRTSWTFYHSITTGLNGTGSQLSDFDITLTLDLNPIPQFTETYASLVLQYMQNTGAWDSVNYPYPAFLVRDPNFVAHGANLKFVEQNGLNYGFESLNSFRPVDIPSDWSQLDSFYDIILRATLGGQVVAEIHAQVETSPSATWS